MKRIGIAGTGRRAATFADQIRQGSRFVRERMELAALYDTNPKRLEAFQSLHAPGTQLFDDYAAFLGDADIDAVIITTPCNSHADLTVKAFEAGKHVFCEKAMALSPADLAAMLEAEKRSGKLLQIGLCLRYADFMQELIPILRRGEIGDVVTASAVETLEGGNHFNRWHRHKEISGGIMLQKGTHTLDLLNWIVDSRPASISAIGGRDVYKARAECAGRRCLTCPEATTCPEFLDIEGDEFYRRIYKDCEDQDGYIWDRCVFDPAIDICDNVMAQVKYENGRNAQYSISLFFSDTGIEREFIILGTEGRIDVSRRREEIVIRRRRSKDVIRYRLEGHGEGGAKQLLDFLDMIENGKKPLADSQAGYWSAMAGLAAERSMEEGRTIQVFELTGDRPAHQPYKRL